METFINLQLPEKLGIIISITSIGGQRHHLAATFIASSTDKKAWDSRDISNILWSFNYQINIVKDRGDILIYSQVEFPHS
jgi:hypothetical protein